MIKRAPRLRRILFAPVDIGMRIEQYSRFINSRYADRLAAESLVVVPPPEEFYTSGFTRVYEFRGRGVTYRWARSIVNFLTSVFRYDVFHFLSGETILTRRLRRFELIVYRLLGKRVIMHFVGCDIRGEAYLKEKSANLQAFLAGDWGKKVTLPWQDALIDDARRYAHTILVSTADLKQVVPEAVFFPVVLDTDKFLQELRPFPRPRKPPDSVSILHSPSNRGIKGTELIHAALMRVAAAAPCRVTLHLPAEQGGKPFYSVPRAQLLQLYRESDIVVDQLVAGWYGMQSVEAIAAGCQAVCYIGAEFQHDLFPGCPITSADANTLERVILDCIERHRAGGVDRERNLDWVRRFHDLQGNNKALTDAWGLT